MTAPGAPPGTIVMPAEIDARFGDGSLFKRSAYRLEQLDEYDSPGTREDIRILPGDLATGLGLPGFDYWLFDGERAAVMYYGDRGTWLHTEIVTEPSFVADCRRWRDQALSRAVPLGDYMARGFGTMWP
jgi:hypothetical protein